MNFASFIFEEIERKEDKVAIFHKTDTITYSSLIKLIRQIIGKLNSLGVQKDEKIILMSDNSIFFVASYFAIIGAGCVAVPLHFSFSESSFNFISKSCDSKVIFVQKKYLKKVLQYNYNFSHIFCDSDESSVINIFSLSDYEGQFVDVDSDSLAVLIFTSGSTGMPKGVMQTHKNLIANTSSIIEYLELTEKDRIMVVLPFSYCFGTSLLHTHLKVHGSCVLNNQFMFPGKVLNEINEKQCTGFAGVPSTYQILLRRAPLKSMKFPTLRYVQQAGGKLANPFILELQEALPTTSIYIMYGQTEATARLSYLPPSLLNEKLGSIGKGIPGVKLEVLNKEGKPVQGDEIGEIVASGDNITKGYWQDAEATAKVFKDGKLYTGDLAKVDSDGYIYLVEREKEILKISGYRVSPKEIEDTIVELNDVVEAAVIGIEDALLGEAAKAYLTIKDNSQITEKDIIEYCKKKLPPYKVPKVVEFIKEIPKNSSGKIDKVSLKKLNKN